MVNHEIINILLVEDHPLFRDAVIHALELEHEFVIVGICADGICAVKAARELKPDVIIMDLNLPGKNGMDAIREIILENPNARIMVITSSVDDETVLNAIKAGAQGYLMKDSTGDQLIRGLREVAHGGRFFPPEVALKLANSLMLPQAKMKNDQISGKHLLSHREREVLNLVGQGLSNNEIATSLQLSSSTIRVHVFNCLAKLGLHNRNQAIRFAIQQINWNID
jgi:two-component system NarL family response regulator